mmetsp:Transcript_3659/g.14389  ORF Transcript_3659/g.14389 Transcript_3659/m.14389 type:complete len:368 (-) Transcript_3659:74-1177(-)
MLGIWPELRSLQHGQPVHSPSTAFKNFWGCVGRVAAKHFAALGKVALEVIRIDHKHRDLANGAEPQNGPVAPRRLHKAVIAHLQNGRPSRLASRLPAVAHVDPSPGPDEILRMSVVLIAAADGCSAVLNGEEIHKSCAFCIVERGPLSAHESEASQPRDSPIGIYVHSDMRGTGRHVDGLQDVPPGRFVSRLEGCHWQDLVPVTAAQFLGHVQLLLVCVQADPSSIGSTDAALQPQFTQGIRCALRELYRLHGYPRGLVAGEEGGIDLKELNLARQAKLHDGPVMASNALAARLPPVHLLPVSGVCVGIEARFFIAYEVVGRCKPFVGSEDNSASHPFVGQIGEILSFADPCHALCVPHDVATHKAY